MWRAAFLPWPTPTVTVRSRGHHVAAGEDARVPGHHVRSPTFTTPSCDRRARHAVQEREVDVLAERQHQGVGLERLELAGGLREALLVELHLLDGDRAARRPALDGREPLDQHALLERLLRPRSRAPASSRACGGRRSSPRSRPGAWRCAPRRWRCCRRRRRPRGGRAAASPRPPCRAAPAPRRGSAPPRRPGCRRAWRCARRPRGTPRRSRRRSSSRGCRRPWCSSSSSTPMSRMRCDLARRARRAAGGTCGMPKRIMPPAIGPASWIVTAWPSRRR